MSEKNNKIKSHLQIAREHYNLSRADVEDYFENIKGINRGFKEKNIYKDEKGLNKLTRKKAELYAELYKDFSVEYLLGLTNVKEPNTELFIRKSDEYTDDTICLIKLLESVGGRKLLVHYEEILTDESQKRGIFWGVTEFDNVINFNNSELCKIKDENGREFEAMLIGFGFSSDNPNASGFVSFGSFSHIVETMLIMIESYLDNFHNISESLNEIHNFNTDIYEALDSSKEINTNDSDYKEKFTQLTGYEFLQNGKFYRYTKNDSKKKK